MQGDGAIASAVRYARTELCGRASGLYKPFGSLYTCERESVIFSTYVMSVCPLEVFPKMKVSVTFDF